MPKRASKRAPRTTTVTTPDLWPDYAAKYEALSDEQKRMVDSLTPSSRPLCIDDCTAANAAPAQAPASALERSEYIIGAGFMIDERGDWLPVLKAPKAPAPKLNQREREILEALLRGKHVGIETAVSTLELERRIRGKQVRRATYSVAIRRLCELELVDTREGKSGGVHLTPKGLNAARAIQKS